MFFYVKGNWQDIHIFQVFMLPLFIMSLLGRQEMFVLLEGHLRIWFVEELMNSYISCYWRYKNDRSELVLKNAVLFFVTIPSAIYRLYRLSPTGLEREA